MLLNRGKLINRHRIKKVFWPAIVLVIIFIIFLILAIFLQPKIAQTVKQFSFFEPVLQIDAPFIGQLYFNDQLGQDKLSKIVIKAIDESQQTIELAMYSFDDQSIRDALYRAAARGVKVKLILSAEKQSMHDQLFENLPKNIQRFDIASDRGYMHHKFVIIDRNQPFAQLLFGSYNFTSLQDKYDPSFLLVSSCPELINSFGQELDRLMSGKSGRSKLMGKDYLVQRFQYSNGFLEVWFGPQNYSNGLKERMVSLIVNAQDDLRAMIWDFTDRDIAQALLMAARRLPVYLLVDDSNWYKADSANKIISKPAFNKLDVITDAKRNQEVQELSGQNDLNSFLHQHMLLVDSKIIVFGTNNWSSRGFYDNDESIIISNINSLVQPFEQSFLFNYKKNHD